MRGVGTDFSHAYSYAIVCNSFKELLLYGFENRGQTAIWPVRAPLSVNKFQLGIEAFIASLGGVNVMMCEKRMNVYNILYYLN